MIHVALIDTDLAAAIAMEQSAKADDARDLTVVWTGANLDGLLSASFDPEPDVVVLDRALLPADPTAALAQLRKRIAARTVITTYTFATARDVDALRGAGSDVVVQGPLSVRTLRTLLLSLLIERRLQRPLASAPAATRPAPGNSLEDGPVVAARYPRAVLLALRDMSTTIQCECPNHVAELVERLMAFEVYSKSCENRDDADAAVHRDLWFASARARHIMEDALDRLLKHERLVIQGTKVTRLTS